MNKIFLKTLTKGLVFFSLFLLNSCSQTKENISTNSPIVAEETSSKTDILVDYSSIGDIHNQLVTYAIENDLGALPESERFAILAQQSAIITGDSLVANYNDYQQIYSYVSGKSLAQTIELLFQEGKINEYQKGIFLQIDNEMSLKENFSEIKSGLISWLATVESNDLLNNIEKQPLLAFCSMGIKSAEIWEMMQDRGPCWDCVKKNKWSIIAVDGVVLTVATLVCIAAAAATGPVAPITFLGCMGTGGIFAALGSLAEFYRVCCKPCKLYCIKGSSILMVS